MDCMAAESNVKADVELVSDADIEKSSGATEDGYAGKTTAPENG